MRFPALAAVLLAVLIASSSIGSAQALLPEDGYAVHRAVPLILDRDGVAGRFEILEDKRVTPELRAEMWRRSKDPAFVLGPDDSLAKEFESRPLRPGKLRLVHAAGFVTFEEQFEVPLGDIEAVSLTSSPKRTFLVTTDYSVGFGSYAGPITGFAEIRDGDVTWLQAVDEESGAMSVISLMASLKRGWRIVEGAAGKEIQEVGCEVDLAGDGPFKTEYGVYRFDGAAWRYRKRVEPGCFELDEDGNAKGPWPEPAAFPR